MIGGIFGVVVGLIFVYLVLSMVCSGITEAIAAVAGLRGKTLEQGIGRLLGPDGKNQLYANRFVQVLAPTDAKRPSYIPASTFATAVLSSFAPGALTAKDAADAAEARARVRAAVESIPVPEVREALTTIAATAAHDIDSLRIGIENWFDDTMQRASGWYTRKAKLILLAIGILVAVSVNVDSFVVASSLWRDPTVRSAAVNAAKAAVTPGTGDTGAAANCPTGLTDPSTSGTAGKVAAEVSCLDQLTLPVGWTSTPGDPRRVPGGWKLLGRIAGWLLTAGALSLGATFWFNALSNLIGLKNTGTKPGTVPPTATPSRPTSPAT